MEKLYYTAKEVAEMLDVSVSHAYKVIREANKELSAKGFYVRAGRVAESILIAKYMTYAIRQHKGKEALEYEQKFLLQQATNLDMRFEDFYKLYEEDLKPKLKLNTWRTKDVIFQKKLIPYFKDKKMNEISPSDIIKWQNEMIKKRQADISRPI